eukprot:gene7657-9420_t
MHIDHIDGSDNNTNVNNNNNNQKKRTHSNIDIDDILDPDSKIQKTDQQFGNLTVSVKNTNTDPFSLLPNEMIFKILSHLELLDLVRASMISKFKFIKTVYAPVTVPSPYTQIVQQNLWKTAIQNNVGFVKGLLETEKKSTINKRYKDGTTPLFQASFYGNLEIVSLLLSNGANSKITDIELNSPLTAAKNEFIARKLLEYGGPVNKFEESLVKMLDIQDKYMNIIRGSKLFGGISSINQLPKDPLESDLDSILYFLLHQPKTFNYQSNLFTNARNLLGAHLKVNDFLKKKIWIEQSHQQGVQGKSYRVPLQTYSFAHKTRPDQYDFVVFYHCNDRHVHRREYFDYPPVQLLSKYGLLQLVIPTRNETLIGRQDINNEINNLNARILDVTPWLKENFTETQIYPSNKLWAQVELSKVLKVSISNNNNNGYVDFEIQKQDESNNRKSQYKIDYQNIMKENLQENTERKSIYFILRASTHSQDENSSKMIHQGMYLLGKILLAVLPILQINMDIATIKCVFEIVQTIKFDVNKREPIQRYFNVNSKRSITFIATPHRESITVFGNVRLILDGGQFWQGILIIIAKYHTMILVNPSDGSLIRKNDSLTFNILMDQIYFFVDQCGLNTLEQSLYSHRNLYLNRLKQNLDLEKIFMEINDPPEEINHDIAAVGRTSSGSFMGETRSLSKQLEVQEKVVRPHFNFLYHRRGASPFVKPQLQVLDLIYLIDDGTNESEEYYQTLIESGSTVIRLTKLNTVTVAAILDMSERLEGAPFNLAFSAIDRVFRDYESALMVIEFAQQKHCQLLCMVPPYEYTLAMITDVDSILQHYQQIRQHRNVEDPMTERQETLCRAYSVMIIENLDHYEKRISNERENLPTCYQKLCRPFFTYPAILNPSTLQFFEKDIRNAQSFRETCRSTSMVPYVTEKTLFRQNRSKLISIMVKNIFIDGCQLGWPIERINEIIEGSLYFNCNVDSISGGKATLNTFEVNSEIEALKNFSRTMEWVYILDDSTETLLGKIQNFSDHYQKVRNLDLSFKITGINNVDLIQLPQPLDLSNNNQDIYGDLPNGVVIFATPIKKTTSTTTTTTSTTTSNMEASDSDSDSDNDNDNDDSNEGYYDSDDSDNNNKFSRSSTSTTSTSTKPNSSSSTSTTCKPTKSNSSSSTRTTNTPTRSNSLSSTSTTRKPTKSNSSSSASTNSSSSTSTTNTPTRSNSSLSSSTSTIYPTETTDMDDYGENFNFNFNYVKETGISKLIDRHCLTCETQLTLRDRNNVTCADPSCYIELWENTEYKSTLDPQILAIKKPMNHIITCIGCNLRTVVIGRDYGKFCQRCFLDHKNNRRTQRKMSEDGPKKIKPKSTPRRPPKRSFTPPSPKKAIKSKKMPIYSDESDVEDEIDNQVESEDDIFGEQTEVENEVESDDIFGEENQVEFKIEEDESEDNIFDDLAEVENEVESEDESEDDIFVDIIGDEENEEDDIFVDINDEDDNFVQPKKKFKKYFL